jgi:hypothetical protein
VRKAIWLTCDDSLGVTHAESDCLLGKDGEMAIHDVRAAFDPRKTGRSSRLRHHVAFYLGDLVPAKSITTARLGQKDLKVASLGVQPADLRLLVLVKAAAGCSGGVTKRLQRAYHVLGRASSGRVVWLTCLTPATLSSTTESDSFTIRIEEPQA